MSHGLPQIKIVLPNAAVTLGSDEINHIFVITPTVTRIITLPTTGVVVGDTIEIHNASATVKITVEASGGGDIASFRDGSMRLMCITATPTTAAHWRMVEATGGANPYFDVEKTSNQEAGTAQEIITWDVINEDNNGDFDLGNEWFLPTVPGLYDIGAALTWAGPNAGDLLRGGIALNSITQEQQFDIAHTSGQGHTQNMRAFIRITTIGTDDIAIFAGNLSIGTGSRSEVAGTVPWTRFFGHRIGS